MKMLIPNPNTMHNQFVVMDYNYFRFTEKPYCMKQYD